ncbi:MAG TPA: protein kinase [Pyrinomonadaceae bacterium]|nr:protein kinase [Pyrinomonadaceae bacterium]
MDSKQWQKVKELFSATLDLPANERSFFLANVEESLRREVEKLLANYDDAEDFIGEPAVVELGFDEPGTNSSLIGKKIDDYLILEEIGAGGLGAVYLAEQQSENLSHRVTVKLIKRGMDTNTVLKRFVLERQILANLEHPNIGRFLDGGSTGDGLPYFVMEYVEGLPVKKYCDAQALDTKARLELFRKVCAAVQFAHQNLIVHRDLKPSNILVTESGEPKLLDFGIAKLLNPGWSLDTAEATATMFRVMTPEYASPEQLRGLPVTTASDVYSLGVILYELLTGERPYKIESRLLEDVAREVLTQEPIKPSAVSSSKFQVPVSRSGNETNPNDEQQTADDGQKTNPKSQIPNPKSLKGDLDNIILKALRKEPERRYQSVQEFSEDIRRHLEGLPVTAMADTVSYRVAKFVKRHKTGVFAVGLVTLTLLTATAVTAWQSVQIRRERDKAEQRFNQVRKLANQVIFEYHDGIEKLVGSTAVREKMVKDAIEYLDNLSAESGTDADLQKELAAAYQKVGDVQGNPYLANLGDQEGALASYQKALAIREALFSKTPDDVQSRVNLALSFEKVGDVLWAKGSNNESKENYQKALAIIENLDAEKNLPPTENYSFVRLHNRIGYTEEQSGDLSGALESYQKSLTYGKSLVESEPENLKYRRGLAVGFIKIGDILHLTKKYPQAFENFQQSLRIFEELAAKDESNANAQRDLTLALARIAASQIELGKYEESLEANRRTLKIQEKLAAADPNNLQIHFDIADVIMNIADTFERMKQFPQAEENYQKAIAIAKEYLAKNADYSKARNHLGQYYVMFAKLFVKKRNLPGALENYRNALAILENEPMRSELPDQLAETYEGIGDALVSLSGKTAEAREMYQKSLITWQKLKEANKLNGESLTKPEEVSQKIAKLNS